MQSSKKNQLQIPPSMYLLNPNIVTLSVSNIDFFLYIRIQQLFARVFNKKLKSLEITYIKEMDI